MLLLFQSNTGVPMHLHNYSVLENYNCIIHYERQKVTTKFNVSENPLPSVCWLVLYIQTFLEILCWQKCLEFARNSVVPKKQIH